MTTFAQALFFEIMCSSEDCEKLWFFDNKLEGEPKGVSIEQFLDEPSGKPSAASSRVYPIRCLTSGSGIVRNGLFLLRLWDVKKIKSQRSKQKRKKLKAPKKHRVSSM